MLDRNESIGLETIYNLQLSVQIYGSCTFYFLVLKDWGYTFMKDNFISMQGYSTAIILMIIPLTFLKGFYYHSFLLYSCL
jgi:hypothetical protein